MLLDFAYRDGRASGVGAEDVDPWAVVGDTGPLEADLIGDRFLGSLLASKLEVAAQQVPAPCIMETVAHATAGTCLSLHPGERECDPSHQPAGDGRRVDAQGLGPVGGPRLRVLDAELVTELAHVLEPGHAETGTELEMRLE